MQQITYNASLLAGTVAASVGAGLLWGVAVGLMVVGGLVLGLTLFGAWLAGKVAA